MKTYKIMTILILILLMISTISQPIQDQKCTSITTIIPIYIGEYFTGNIYIKEPTGQTYWCTYTPKNHDYFCKEFGK